jgi:hypothetical protein
MHSRYRTYAARCKRVSSVVVVVVVVASLAQPANPTIAIMKSAHVIHRVFINTETQLRYTLAALIFWQRRN